jgi:hypothetical protein
MEKSPVTANLEVNLDVWQQHWVLTNHSHL